METTRAPKLQRVPVYEVRLIKARRGLRLAESTVSDAELAARTLHALIGLTPTPPAAVFIWHRRASRPPITPACRHAPSVCAWGWARLGPSAPSRPRASWLQTAPLRRSELIPRLTALLRHLGWLQARRGRQCAGSACVAEALLGVVCFERTPAGMGPDARPQVASRNESTRWSRDAASLRLPAGGAEATLVDLFSDD
jgi:hypothetical protein